MTETFYRTGIHIIDHSTFGGIIYPSDFNTDHRGKDSINGSLIANRIVNDWIFDRRCEKNKEDSNKKIIGGNRKMIKSNYKGTTIEIKLPEECGHEDYFVECTYRYNKYKDKYLLSMWLKRKDIDSKFKIESQEVDTQYITSNKYTITRDICTLVEYASLIGYFEPYIKRYEYEQKCFERGNELYEKESFLTYINE